MSKLPYENLTPDTVLDAIESAGFITDARILILNSYENRVYQVGIEGSDPVILKFYRPNRWTDNQILEEHQFTLNLMERELPVVAPLVNDSGSSLYYHKEFTFAVYPRKGGHAPEFDNLDNLYVMGRFLGRMHAMGEIKDYEYRPALDIHTFGQASVQFLLENNFLSDNLEASYKATSASLLDRVDDLFTKHSPDKIIRLHGDCHPGNILWRDEAPNFVDFDDSRMGPAIQDIWMLLSGDRNRQRLQLSEIVDGYNEFHDFPYPQLPLMEALRALRIIHYTAWLARRWEDPAFPKNFPWFNTENYWAKHIADLQEQLLILNEPPLSLHF